MPIQSRCNYAGSLSRLIPTGLSGALALRLRRLAGLRW